MGGSPRGRDPWILSWDYYILIFLKRKGRKGWFGSLSEMELDVHSFYEIWRWLNQIFIFLTEVFVNRWCACTSS